MGRRLMWNREASPSHVLSALDSGGAAAEEGLRVDAAEETDVDGLMELFTGGTPTEEKELYIDTLRSGNLGTAEWGWADPTEDDFYGHCSPWIPSDFQNPFFGANINVAHRIKRADHPDEGIMSLMVFNDGGTLYFTRYLATTRSWLSSQTIATVTSQRMADVLMFPDTGETVIFCDGDLYSADGASYTGGSNYFIKSSISGWSTTYGSAESITLVYARGALVLLFTYGTKAYAALSYDRGGFWESPVAVSDDFVDSVTSASDLHAAVSPIDGNIYMVISDDTGGTSTLRVYRSAGGLIWDRVNDGSNLQTPEDTGSDYPTIAFLEDGTMLVGCEGVDPADGYVLTWLDALGENNLDRAGRNNTISILYTELSNKIYATQVVDLGSECLCVSNFRGDFVSSWCIISMGCRLTSNISEDQGYDSINWINTIIYSPNQGWNWSKQGTATESKTSTRMTLPTTDANSQITWNYTAVNAEEFIPLKVKFKIACGDNCDYANRRVGARFRHESSTGKGYDFGIYFDDDQIRIYDHGAAAWLGSVQTVDFSSANEIFLDIIFDSGSGGGWVTYWIRPIGTYPLESWEIKNMLQFANTAPFGSERWDVEWGNFSNVAGQTTTSHWYYFLMGMTAEGATALYKNVLTDHTSLQGKICSSQSQYVAYGITCWWRGAAAYRDDRWTVETRYLWEKGNVFRGDPKRQWRSDADQQEVNLVFYQDDLRKFRPDWVSLHGLNFEKFYIEADDAVTFDSGGGGSPTFSMRVAWGTAAGDDAISTIAPYLEIENLDNDFVQIKPSEASETNLWKGRFDKDNILGRNWYLRIMTGNKANDVYRIESIEMLDDNGGASWQIMLAANEDGSYPELLEAGDAVAIGDEVGIFGDALAIELPPSTFYRPQGYKYMRIRIENQTTWHGDYRIGYVLLGMSAPFGPPYNTATLTNIPKVPDAEWNSLLSTAPNVSRIDLVDGSVTKRRRGRGKRQIELSWTGLQGIESWQSIVRSMLEAAHSDIPVVFMEEDAYVHAGPVTPTGTPSRVCYDPILCYVEGILQSQHAVYKSFTPKNAEDAIRGMITDISGVILSEIV